MIQTGSLLLCCIDFDLLKSSFFPVYVGTGFETFFFSLHFVFIFTFLLRLFIVLLQWENHQISFPIIFYPHCTNPDIFTRKLVPTFDIWANIKIRQRQTSNTKHESVMHLYIQLKWCDGNRSDISKKRKIFCDVIAISLVHRTPGYLSWECARIGFNDSIILNSSNEQV